MSRALIVGCGYVGMRLATRLQEAGVEVFGTTRDEGRATELEGSGITPILGQLTDRATARQLDRIGPDVVFYLVPPPRGAPDPLPDVLNALARAPLEAWIYASSTSVYGDRGGAWVDEATPVQLESETARARQAAERATLEAGWSHQAPVRICRLAGIYGPGRTLRGPLSRGEYLLIRGHDSWVNRIHVHDLVTALVAAWTDGRAGRIYNISDGEPHRASEFALLAARLHGLPEPEWVELEEARQRYGERRLRRKLEAKRVKSDRMRAELGVELEYPDYRSGLPAAVESERQTGQGAS